MRTSLLIANAAVAVLFTAFFAYTFFGRSHIDRIARDFVTAKTQKLVTPAVEAAGEGLRSELARRLLSKEQVAAVEAEIAQFRAQPKEYIQRLTSAQALPKARPSLSKMSELLSGWKERIRMHYNKVLRRLFTDLRIFAGSNVVAACIAFACAWRFRERPSPQLIAISAMLLIAIGLSVQFYIDSFSFFTIPFDWYLGWSYVAFLGFLFVYMFIEYAGSRRVGVL